MTRRVIVHKEIKDGMETIDLLTMQRDGLVDKVHLVDKNLARLKHASSFAKENILQKFELQDLESNRKNILKETDKVDKLITLEFANGAREMRWNLLCVGPLHQQSPETRETPCDAEPPNQTLD